MSKPFSDEGTSSRLAGTAPMPRSVAAKLLASHYDLEESGRRGVVPLSASGKGSGFASLARDDAASPNGSIIGHAAKEAAWRGSLRGSPRVQSPAASGPGSPAFSGPNAGDAGS